MTAPVLPYVASPVGDVVEAWAAARKAAARWGLGDPEVLRVGMNALFACGDEVVLRVGRPTGAADAAPRLAARLAAIGLRVPRYLDEMPECYGDLVVWGLRREYPAGEIDWAEVGEMVAVLHASSPTELVDGYPVPRAADFPWWQFDRLLADTADLLDPRARAGLESAVAVHGDWAHRGATEVLCHGDVHPGNVLATAAGPMLLDWDLLCCAPAAWDHAPLLTWAERWGGQPAAYERFAAGYATSFRGDSLAEALATLRLAAAALMRVRAGRHDPAAADEAERRLRWWRGDPDAPAWHAQ